ncbi:MAG: GntG family PLP-dependent aldolase [Saprospiraceae bacterium]
MEVNIISDTVTKPCKEMLAYMMAAEVGDDVFREDATVNLLEERMCALFGKEAGLFCPSGTMTNQIAIKVHTKSLDEMICEIDSHVYQAESAGFAFHSGISIQLIQGKNGKMSPDQISSGIKPGFDWQPITKLVVLENSCNKGGGSYYTCDEVDAIHKVTTANNLKMHLDGARIFNVLAETGEEPEQHGRYFDSVSVCFSKGLGAPVGSILLGNYEFIREARRFRKVMGGGMRQAGILAAGALWALEHNIPQLKEDNNRAKIMGEVLSTKSFVRSIKPVKTNIVIFTLNDNIPTEEFLKNLKSKGVLGIAFGHQTIRFVMHRDISEQQFEHVLHVLRQM